MANQGTLGFTIQDSSRPTHIMVWQEPRSGISVQNEQSSLIISLMERVSEMERTIQELKEVVETQNHGSIPYFAENVNPLPNGMHEVSGNWEQESEDSEEDTRVITILKEEPAEFDHDAAEVLSDDGVKKNNTFIPEQPIDTCEVEEESANQHEAEEVEGEADEEEEAEEAEEEEAEEESEGEADEEEAAGEELLEFEHNGVTYYRDSDNLVYTTDEDGDLVDEPIGRWSEEKQKILKIKK
jgi:hypothetical protein